MEKTVCELFAGVGGFRCGFERAERDWKTVWFSQWEPNKKKQWAHECYVKHFGDCKDINGEYHTNEDIATVDKNVIPDFTVLTAGFPCQDYSVASTTASAKGIEGKKGVLWWQIYETMKAKKPAFCLFENVDRLLKSPKNQRGRDFGVMLACLSELGYDAEWRIVDSSKWGAAQRRKRVYIFAYRRNTFFGKLQRSRDLTVVLRKEGFMQKTFPIITYEDLHSCTLSNDIGTVSDTFTFNFGDAGVMRDGEVMSGTVIDEFGVFKPLKSIMEHNVDEKYYISADKMERWVYLKGSKRINRVNKDGVPYVYTEGKYPFPDDPDKFARTILTTEGSMIRPTHVVADLDTGRLRTLTPIEVERLQGFDDNWTEGMPERMRYFCMGNSLVVSMIEFMAYKLAFIVERESLADVAETYGLL